jgi:phage/plasmid-like protein (TIGR03299 family)
VPVQNVEAFEFLDAVLGSELCFETAGSIWAGRRVWVLARIPEFITVGGDETAQYVFIANGHDGSLAVTAAVTPIRIVCNNTLTYALSKAELRDAKLLKDGAPPQTVKFRHTTNVTERWEEARKVMQLTVDYNARFKELGDTLASQPLPENRFRKAVLEDLFPKREGSGDRAATNRQEAIDAVLTFFRGEGADGDTRGNAPGTKWTAVNAIAEYSDWGRRTTQATDQVYRSFADGSLKQKGLKLVLSA